MQFVSNTRTVLVRFVKITDELIHQSMERNDLLVSIHSDREIANSDEIHMNRLMSLVSVRNDLVRASQGLITPEDNPVFIALQDVFKKYPIRLQDFETVIEGM